MINASGIGTYITNVVPSVIDSFSNVKFNILGSRKYLLSSGIFNNYNTEFIEFHSPIYSIKEQLLYPYIIPQKTDLFWSPHYNIPVFYSGKLMVSIMDLGHLALRKINKGIFKNIYANFMFNQVKRNAVTILYISQFSKNEFNRIIGKPRAYETVTLLGVDHSWFNIPQNKNDVEVTEPYILYVGNVKPHKNLGNLIQSFNIIRNEIPHDLVIVGKKDGFITPDNSLLNEVIRSDKKIIFTGELSDLDLKEYMQGADIFVFPSLYEGFGLPPLEAMAAGTPVVASNAASIPEVCEDAALYFNPENIEDIAEKILEIIRNKKLKYQYIQKGYLRSKLFDWDKTIKKTTKAIQNILND